MASNIEIKACIEDINEMRARVQSLSELPLKVISQEDTFFNTKKGRLKLRVLAPDSGELIYYERADQESPKRSEYHLARTHDPESLKTALALALGVRGVVVKTRYLYMAGQTRIHLDDVEGLGQFIELEVVLEDEQNDAEGQAIAEDLMHKLGIRKDDLLKGAYMDMLEFQPR